MSRRFSFPALHRSEHGSMAIETALIAPLLATLALGTFDVSMMVAREHHLQSASNEAAEIVLAAAGGSGIQSDELETVLRTSLDLTAEQLNLDEQFRCGTSTTISTTKPTCASGEPMYSYVQLTVTDTYTPVWTSFGLGKDVNFNIQRTVQIK